MGRKLFLPFWERIPDLIYGKSKHAYNLSGFKFFYYHPVDDSDSSRYIYKYIFDHPEIKVIHWLREDLFAVILSRFIALKTGKWARTKNETEITAFAINVKEFEYELEKTLSEIQTVKQLFKDYDNYFELSYEDVTERNKLNDLLEFLEVKDFKLSHNSKSSQGSKNKYKFIENIDELQKIYEERIAQNRFID